MKIAYFVGTFREIDGVTRVLLKIIEEANRRNIANTLVTGWFDRTRNYPTKITKVPSINFPLYRAYYLSSPAVREFKKQIDQFKPNLIHIHSPETLGWAALRYAKEKRIPIIATHHTDFVEYLPYYHASWVEPLLWTILRNLYNQMNLVTTPSSVITQKLKENHIRHVITIPNGVDLEVFNPRFKSDGWRKHITGKKDKSIILSVSRLSWEKDLTTLAQTYRLLQTNKVNFTMAIAGMGPAKNELKKLMPKAKFLGHLQKKELRIAYASSDILLFPSSTETFGNVTIEAMASGLVPIVANAGGSKTIVQNRIDGLLSKPKNAQDFYRNIQLLIKNRNLKNRLAETAIKHAKKYSWDKVLNLLFKKYEEVIRR